MPLKSRVVFSPLLLFLILVLSLSFVYAEAPMPTYHITVSSGDHGSGQTESHHDVLDHCGKCMKHNNPAIAGHLRSFTMTTTRSSYRIMPTNRRHNLTIKLSFYSGTHCNGALHPIYTGTSQNVGTTPSSIRKAASHQVCYEPMHLPIPPEI
ncbi:hypothetical protein BJ138DRAFT_460574 [Hygrophoropsis aurantiaca]|uniref:Uncharacterized protein n=1 Tax=Hygrophoropsis aurantiaca TaxID=72124 RepID=A0ACB8A3K0_9AGAM|nr:hypothetical protein BJ138DRAFT_460574 [Hygrophoropsis aurantiaca]